MAAQALAPGFAAFALANIVSRIGGSPQHPVGNGLLAEQFPVHRRGFAISAHIAGGNVGTVAVPLIGAWLIAGIGWRWTVVLFGVPAILIALAIWALVRESGAIVPRRVPTATSAPLTGPCCAIATCCSSMPRRCSAAAAAAWACSTSSCRST
jgi:MFS family permease